MSTVDDNDEDDHDSDWLWRAIPLCVHVMLMSPRWAGSSASDSAADDGADVVLPAVQWSRTRLPRRTTEERGSTVKYGADEETEEDATTPVHDTLTASSTSDKLLQ